ncbi:nutritionally-regulated adipose and cardiac enriched protein-like protein [Alligator mississippiensis]|uniref:Nutritionally-regulated adipose and cardiac enriched protein-like protein n=1 Tax=Alligator mississippiensis TaxID=8496 RepID=A0A151M265_ALLMI|nr:nutritionally-regulated adipose and cardiac enriched protein-like protein [Alligator mississippiensis]
MLNIKVYILCCSRTLEGTVRLYIRRVQVVKLKSRAFRRNGSNAVMRFLNSEDLFMLECKYPDVLRPGKAGRPDTTSVKTLQKAAGSGSSDHFRSPEAADVLQHEEEPAGTPMHRREMTNCSNCPPSILRKRPPVNQAVGEKRKSERRVRFQEPEEIHEHAQRLPAYPLHGGEREENSFRLGVFPAVSTWLPMTVHPLVCLRSCGFCSVSHSSWL